MRLTITVADGRSERTALVEGSREEIINAMRSMGADPERYIPEEPPTIITPPEVGGSGLDKIIIDTLPGSPWAQKVSDPAYMRGLDARLAAFSKAKGEEFMRDVMAGKAKWEDLPLAIFGALRTFLLSEFPDFPEAAAEGIISEVMKVMPGGAK